MPELAPLLKTYWQERWRTAEAVMSSSLDTVTDDQLHAERGLYQAILTVISANPSNQAWFFTLLPQIDPTTRVELLSIAIGAACQSPLEPVLMNFLTGLLDEYPTLFTLKTAEEISNHANDESNECLVAP